MQIKSIVSDYWYVSVARTRTIVLLAVALASTCSAAERIRLLVTAISYDSARTESTMVINRPTNSNTACSGTGTNSGPYSTAQVNCNTRTTGGPQAFNTSRLDVTNIVEAKGQRYTIACTGSWSGSKCSTMETGGIFEAEYDGKRTMWIIGHQGGNLGKRVKIKYRVLDMRPVVATASPDIRK